MSTTTTTSQADNTGGKDPRCPHCGKPVLGVFVQGNEGKYHLACTQPVDETIVRGELVPIRTDGRDVYYPKHPWMWDQTWRIGGTTFNSTVYTIGPNRSDDYFFVL